jgi:hypothetical protein
VQERGNFRCQHRGYFEGKVSEEHGYRCKCRNPRCSFECKCAWAARESAIDAYFLTEKLPILMPTAKPYRGNLTMPKGASREAHRDAQAKFSRAVKAIEKKIGRVIRFRAVAHDTGKHERHYDYHAYAEGVRPKTMRRIFLTAARKAGFLRATCRPMTSPQQIKGTAAYNFKRDVVKWDGERRQYVKQVSEYVLLPAAHGSRVVWGSHRFYLDSTKDALWQELRRRWFSAGQRPTKQDNKSTTISDQIRRYLPTRQDEAVSVYFLEWHIAWPEEMWSAYDRYEVLKTLLDQLPGVRSAPDRKYWLESDGDTPLAEKIFGGGPITYHEKWHPLPLDVDVVCRPLAPKPQDEPGDEPDPDFLRELEALEVE